MEYEYLKMKKKVKDNLQNVSLCKLKNGRDPKLKECWDDLILFLTDTFPDGDALDVDGSSFNWSSGVWKTT